MAVDFGFFVSSAGESSLFFLIVVFDVDWVEIMSSPVSMRCFSLKNLLVSLDFWVVMLQVLVRNNIVVFEVFVKVLFGVDLEFLAFWPFFRCVVVMLFQIIVTDNIVVNKWISFGSEIPWLLFWIIWPIFKTCKFVFEVYYIVGLLISEGSIFILGQDVDKCTSLRISSYFFSVGICVNLSDRIVTRLLSLDVLIGDLDIWIRVALEVSLGVDVCTNIFFPVAVVSVSWEEHFVGGCLCDFLV